MRPQRSGDPIWLFDELPVRRAAFPVQADSLLQFGVLSRARGREVHHIERALTGILLRQAAFAGTDAAQDQLFHAADPSNPSRVGSCRLVSTASATRSIACSRTLA